MSTCYPRRKFPNHGIFVHRQARALADLGVECHVLQPVEWSPPAPFHRLRAGWKMYRSQQEDLLDEVEGIRVHHPPVYLPVPSRFFPGDYWERMGRGVARYIRRHRQLRSADLLYAHFLCHEGYAGLIAARELKMPLVAIALGDDVHAWPERWPDRKPKLASVLREADGLLACSRGLARDAQAWATEGLSTPVEVVYMGIDTETFSPAESMEDKTEARRLLGLPEERRLLLCVATTIEAKGWLDLLDAFAALGDDRDGWDIVMVGSPRGSKDLNLVAEAEARGLGDCSHWLGCLPPVKMPDLYLAVDAFVLASHNEGLSNSVMEAMSTGLPVVATDVGGHSEIIDDGLNGWLVPPRDVPSLTEALREALTDAQKSAWMGEAARERAIRIGDYNKNAQLLLPYFEKVLAARRQSRAGAVVF
ncbi:MAG: glycosyltransferase [Acidobacteriota bacterium]